MFTKNIIVLTVLLIASLTHAFTGGNGTAGNPYQISTRADLEAVNNNLAASYILIKDIDLAGTIYTNAVIASSSGTTWSFVGTKFTGSFNGNCFKIYNLTISASGKNYIGLFGYTETNAAISNICLTGGSVSGRNYVGDLVGYSNGINTNCYSTGNVSGYSYIGGLVGSNSGSNTNCYSTGSVSGSFTVGGFVGYNDGINTNCYSAGNVSGTGNAFGGLVGSNSGSNTNCYSTGSVSGGAYVGGLVGSNSGSNTHCYSTGRVSGFADYVGALVGSGGSITNCFWDKNTAGITTSAGGIGKTTAQMKTQSTFTAWDFNSVWVMPESSSQFAGYPILKWQQIFTVTFSAGTNGIISSGQTEQTIPYGNSAVAPTATPNEGWLFTGWDVAFDNVTSDLTVTAQYEQQTFTVTFDAGDNGTIAEGEAVQTVVYGGAAVEPTITANAGWIFTGWDTDFSNVESNLTVTAQYTMKTIGLAGKALSLDGINDFVKVPTAAHLSGMAAITIEAWFCPFDTQGNSPLVWKSDGGDIYSQRSYEFIFNNTQNKALTSYFSGSSSWTLIYKEIEFTANEWYHFATTYDSIRGVTKIFVNGELINSVYTQADEISPIFDAIRNSNQNLLLGAAFSQYFQGSFAHGLLDEIRIWNYARSEEQITQNHNRLIDSKAIGLIAYFNFDEDFTEQNVYDLTNYANHGTLGESSSIEDKDPQRQVSTAPIIDQLAPFSGGDGSLEQPYKISTQYDLESVNRNLAAHYILMNDIDLTGITYAQAVIAPDTGTLIGFQGTPFTGTFDGNGFKIKNLTISASGKDYIGLFGHAYTNAVIKNVGLTGGSVNGHDYVGGLVGLNAVNRYGSGGGAVYYTNCYSTGSVSGNYYVGGLMGYNSYYGYNTNCYSTGTVSGLAYLGGLMGYNGGHNTNCYSTGTVSGLGNLGGLMGMNEGYNSNCYSTGNLSGGSNHTVGGLAGINQQGQFINCYATCVGGAGLVGEDGMGIIINCYATGGGLMGYIFGSTITNCFWDVETSGQSAGWIEILGGEDMPVSIITNVVGKTTAQMQDINTFTSASWDFVGETANGVEDVWYMEPGGYPRLNGVGENKGIVVEQLIVAARRRVGRTVFEYDLRVKVKNVGGEVDGIQLNLVEYPTNVQVLSSEPVTAGAMAAGAQAICGGLLTLRIDRETATDTGRITWHATRQDAIGGQDIEIITSEINLTTFGADGIGHAELYEIANNWLLAGLADVNYDGIVNYEDMSILTGLTR